MNRNSLIGGALIATIMSLMSVGGATAQPSSIYAPGSLFHAAPTDLILVVSDLVDLERAIKAGGPEERERSEASHVGRAALVGMPRHEPPTPPNEPTQ